MRKFELDSSPPSPEEQMANVYESLADDIFDVPLDTDDETNERASRIARAALDKALASDPTADSAPKSASGPPPAKPTLPPESDPHKSSTKTGRLGWFFERLVGIFRRRGSHQPEPQASGTAPKNAEQLIIKTDFDLLSQRRQGKWVPNVPVNPKAPQKEPANPNEPHKPIKPPRPPLH
jgi:hypothetical protein